MPTKMAKQGDLEVAYLKKTKYVIGRTEWDKVHTWAVNPNAHYYVGNETLREPFYHSMWNIDLCRKHSIFLSQAAKPIKGIHKLLEALPFVLRHYPDTVVYVAGPDFTSRKTLRDKIKYGTYAKYINCLIKKYNLTDKIKFLGLLDEKQMVDCYLKSHVFVCPSSIENSPNSLGEAQLLGVPSIASYVGGTPDMISHNKTGLLYRFEEHEMLAYNICKCFSNPDFCVKLSHNERTEALIRHDGIRNANETIAIYNAIISQR